MRHHIAMLIVFASTVGLMPAQTITIGTGVVQNLTGALPSPYGAQQLGHRQQYLITAAELTAAGALANTPIIAIGFDVVSFAGNPSQNFSLSMGHSANTTMSTWATGLTSVANAPTYTPTVGWNTHTLCTPFSWNGSSNVVLEVCQQSAVTSANAVINMSTGAVLLSRMFWVNGVGACANTGVSSTSNNRPNMQLTFGAPVPTEWQTNSSGATLSMAGASSNGCTPAILNQTSFACGATTVPSTGSIFFSSTALGMPWDVAISGSNLLPASGGGTTIPAGVINLNVAQPLSFVNGFFGSNLPNFTFPGITSASFTWAYSLNSAVDLGMQALVINPTAPAGASLSQATEFHNAHSLTGVASIGGPITAGGSTLINLTAPNVCWPAITMFGTSYTQMCLTSYGRVQFQGTVTTATTDFTPTVAEAQAAATLPFIGFWTYLQVLNSGTITASVPAPGLVRVDWNALQYQGEFTSLNTFGMMFDTTTGIVQLDGLAGIIPNPQVTFTAANDSQYLGMSRGAGATDGGITTFAAGGSGVSASATRMWYDWYGAVVGGAGLVNSLVPGTLNSVVFTPSLTAIGNYDWAGF